MDINKLYFSCDRCGKVDSIFNKCDLKPIYQYHECKVLCQDCGGRADKFIKYFGKKKQEDLNKLAAYLGSGKVSKVSSKLKYDALMNSGYY